MFFDCKCCAFVRHIIIKNLLTYLLRNIYLVSCDYVKNKNYNDIELAETTSHHDLSRADPSLLPQAAGVLFPTKKQLLSLNTPQVEFIEH